jgi:hypothetical protein
LNGNGVECSILGFLTQARQSLPRVSVLFHYCIRIHNTAGQFEVAIQSTTMPINFFSFPSEIRNKIYEEALVLSELIVLCAMQYGGIYGLALPRNSLSCGPLRLCPAILLANKRAHHEASTLLYSRNRFRLDKGFLTVFLDQIGPQNASFLRHICIAFPAFNDHRESVTLKEDSIRTLERIRDNCTNLATLETSLGFRTINIMESAIDAPDSPRAAALALVDARFKAISSLKEIIVTVYDEPLSCGRWEEMRGCGWTIEGTWEESESVGSYDEEDDYWWDHYGEQQMLLEDYYWRTGSDWD